jgi:hypothetical protein
MPYCPETVQQTIRRETATACLQGLLAGYYAKESTPLNAVDEAIEYADALLAALSKEEQP